jgi:predicted nucleic acid-binding protein
VSRAVLDTSILIAREQGRPLQRQLPDQVAISVQAEVWTREHDFTDFSGAVPVVRI